MKTFRINRKKWGRGSTGSELWNSYRQVGCCLGHITRQHNHCSWADLKGKAYPSYNKTDNYFLSNQARYSCPIKSKRALHAAAKINDDTQISDKVREARLVKFMAKRGIKLEFYN